MMASFMMLIWKYQAGILHRLMTPSGCISSPMSRAHSVRNASQDPNPAPNMLTSQTFPAERVVQTLEPVAMNQPKKGTYVFDFGQNFSGWARLLLPVS